MQENWFPQFSGMTMGYSKINFRESPEQIIVPEKKYEQIACEVKIAHEQKVWPVFPIRPKGQNATQVVGDDSGRFSLSHELWMKRKYAFLPKLFNNLSDRTLVNVRSVLSDTQVRSSKFRVRLDAFISETVNFSKKIIGTLFVENKMILIFCLNKNSVRVIF